MEALEFTTELKRMCHSCEDCGQCGLYTGGDTDNYCYVGNLEKAIPIVEKWAKEHPIIRNVDHVAEELEKLGYTVSKMYIVNYTCPIPYFSYYDARGMHCPEEVSGCKECRKWWLEEYKEQSIRTRH